jgi:hypothetical protein
MTEEITQTEVPAEGQVIDGEGNPVDVAAAEAALKEGKDLKAEAKAIEYPDFVPEKFRTGEDYIEKMAKSYTELEKTLREKGKLAPETYELDDSEAIAIDPEHDIYKGFAEVAKGENMTNKQFNAALRFATEAGFFDVPNYEEEMASLGSDKDLILNGISSFGETRLTPKEYEILKNHVYEAEFARVLHKIIRINDNRTIPAKPGDANVEGKADLQKRLSALLSDPEIRSNLDKKQEAENLARKIASM